MENIYIGVAILNLIGVILQIFMDTGKPYTGPRGIVFLDNPHVSNTYTSTWIFSVWTFVCIWQGLFTFYPFFDVCRRTLVGMAYASPVFLPFSLSVMTVFVMAIKAYWLGAYNGKDTDSAFVANPLLECTSFALTYIALDNGSPKPAQKGLCTMTSSIVHNGIGVWIVCVTSATLFNIGVLMTFKADPSISLVLIDSDTDALTIIKVEILIFVIIDLVEGDRCLKYIIVPYLVLALALVVSICRYGLSPGKRIDDIERNVIGLGWCGMVVVLKLITIWYKRVRRKYETGIDILGS